jgi:hypothetical protein
MRRPYMDFYNAMAIVGKGQRQEGIRKLGSLAKSDTYEDVKANAYYHLADQLMLSPKPNFDLISSLLKKSVDFYPQAHSLLAAGRCAVKRQKWQDARTYLDRCIREFPRSEPAVHTEAKQLLARVSQAEAGRKR